MKKFILLLFIAGTMNGSLLAMTTREERHAKQREKVRIEERNRQLAKQFIVNYEETIYNDPKFQRLYHLEISPLRYNEKIDLDDTIRFNQIMNIVTPYLNDTLWSIDNLSHISENEKEKLKQGIIHTNPKVISQLSDILKYINKHKHSLFSDIPTKELDAIRRTIIQMDPAHTFALLPLLASELQSMIVSFLIQLELNQPWEQRHIRPNIEKFTRVYLTPQFLTKNQIKEYFELLDKKIVETASKPWYPSLTYMFNVLDPENKLLSSAEKKDILSKSLSKEEYQKLSQKIANKLLPYHNSLSYLAATNQIPSLDEIKSGQELDLSNKNLTTLLPNMFQGFNNLTTLILDDNNLESINANDLQGLSNLTRLSLQNNQLKTLNTDEIKRLTHLQHIYLGGNQFSPEEQERIKSELTANIPTLVIHMDPIDVHQVND